MTQNAQHSTLQVTHLHYHKQSGILDVAFSDNSNACFEAEFLRVLSPSAEVRGHGKPKLVTNKKHIGISALTPVGYYAVKIVFDDGHDSGIYSWQYLKQLADNKETLWQQYLVQLEKANANRDSLITVSVRY